MSRAFEDSRIFLSASRCGWLFRCRRVLVAGAVLMFFASNLTVAETGAARPAPTKQSFPEQGFHSEVEHPSVLTVSKAWVRLMPPKRKMTAAYFVVTNESSHSVEILGVGAPWARSCELHQTIRRQGVARMVPLANPVLAPGQSFVFKPGGPHVMIMGVNQKLLEGNDMPFEIRFKYQLKNLEPEFESIQFNALVARSEPQKAHVR